MHDAERTTSPRVPSPAPRAMQIEACRDVTSDPSVERSVAASKHVNSPQRHRPRRHVFTIESRLLLDGEIHHAAMTFHAAGYGIVRKHRRAIVACLVRHAYELLQ